MFVEITGGFRMARRRWLAGLGVAGMTVVAATVLAIVLGDVLSEIAVLKGGSELRKQHAVSFTPFYPEGGMSDVGEAARSTLETMIAHDDAYTSVVSNVEIENPAFAGGRHVVVIVGDAPVGLFPDLHLCSPAPCAMRGYALRDDEIDPIDFAGRRWDPIQVLPPVTTFFDPNSAGLILDNVVVLHATSSDIENFDGYEREEALTKAILLNPDDSATSTYITGAALGDLYLVPHDLHKDQPHRFRDMMIRSAMYIIGLLAFFTLLLAAFTAIAKDALRQESGNLAIRRIYGARPSHIATRVATFLAMILLAAPVPVLLALKLIGRPVADGASMVLACVFAIYLALVVSMVRQQARQDPIQKQR